MLNLTWNLGKTYVYPTYTQQTYLVPDQIYVRTVARTDAVNNVYHNSSQMQRTLGVSVGVDYNRLIQGARKGVTKYNPTNVTSANNSTSNSTLPSQAGYFQNLDGSLPASQHNDTTTLFTLGLTFDFIHRNTKTADNQVIQNDQVFQLWQMTVDQLQLASDISNDIALLAGLDHTLYPAQFGSFFEKYGTHFVFSAVLGGAARHTALISTLATTTFTQTDLSLTVSYNTTTNSTVTNTQTASYILNSANCTGLQTGWTYNTLTMNCESK